MEYDEFDFRSALKRVRTVLILWLVVLIALALLASCGTTEYVPVVQTNMEHYWHTDSVVQRDSVIKESLTTVMQLDSAEMARYGIQLKAAEKAWLVKTAELERQIQRLESMRGDSTHIIDSIPVPFPVEVKVQAELTTWQKFRLNMANIMIYLLIAVVMWYAWRFYRDLRNYKRP